MIATVVAFICKEPLTEIIFAPANESFITFRLLRESAQQLNLSILEQLTPPPISIINTQMAGQFNLHIAISFWTALIATTPFILLQMWLFVKPALSANVIRKFRGGVLLVSLLFFTGVSFGYFVISPLAINFLSNYQLNSNIQNMIEFSSYLSTVMNISLAAGIAFQLPLLVHILSSIGILSANMLRKYRRHAIAIIVIASAILTPPDIISQILLTIPLLALYELSITIAARNRRGKTTK